jgi:hypothetical protein
VTQHACTSAPPHVGTILLTCILSLLACASGRLPGPLHRYSIVVEEKDPQSVELARALRDQGVKVRSRVRGGSGPTAALIYFTFSYPETGEPTWFHLRLADTRSGVIVRASTIQLDSTTVTPRDRARAAVSALLAPQAP